MTVRAGSTHDDRLTRLESSVENLTQGLNRFINEAHEHRASQALKEEKLWAALEKNRAHITWPLIVTVGGFVFTLIGAAAGLGHMFVELRVQQLEIEDHHIERTLNESHRDVERLEDRVFAK